MSDTDSTIDRRHTDFRVAGEKLPHAADNRHRPLDPTVCTDCGVVYREGRWQWLTELPPGAHQARCPACTRIHDRTEAGLLMLSGTFFREHRDEIMNLVRHRIDTQSAEHPLHRIMNVREEGDDTVFISFTDRHSPAGVGHAIEKAYQGELDIRYAGDDGVARVSWQRDG